MKYVFYILILVNVVFFLWENNVTRSADSADGSYQELRLPHTVERIALFSEHSALTEKTPGGIALAEASTTEAKPEQTDGTTAVSDSEPAQETVPPVPKEEAAPPELARASEGACFQLGPLADESRALEVLSLVKTHSDQASLVKKPSDLTDGWWVLFPKAQDIEVAKSNRRMLIEKGVTDLWLFDKGPLQGAISLGLFKTRRRAEQAQKQFTEQSIITEVVPRQVRNEAQWVRVPWTRPASELEEILKSADAKVTSGQLPPPVPCD
ncbi:hypothetical protein [Methylocaldum sp.]|uniref:hypothetical protein n=1 Tax=Methylocaldum sp. TaxID=1969727 RepID=UPI002D669BA2|nr:hypothetical protein [Methylocaldum sp.]HYE36233.1 hypothetical protein [Methylocaldum sp.]